MSIDMKTLVTAPVAVLLATGAFAQLAPPPELRKPPPDNAPLSSPIGGAPGTAVGAVPGQGAGYHDPRSAFKPLEDKDGVVSWKLLTSVETKMEKNRVAPQFSPAITALNDKTVRVQGFMMPLEPGDRQRHFLLSAVPTTCSFCVPAGPQGLIEVRTKIPVKYSIDPVVVEGKFAALTNDQYGLFYRITEATQAP
jgi:uncharacterized protein